jgi:hypothetical protein
VIELLACLDREEEQENRAPAEFGGRSATGETAALDTINPVEEDDHDHPPTRVYDRG